MPRKKKAGELNISLNEISQEVDLKKYLGRKPTASEKRAFAELAVDTINNRTLDGETINGGKFKKYSKAYAEFKGVTRDSVDMFLEGDMLESIGRRSSKEKVNTVFIQMEKGLQTKKAFNHQTGDTLPKREFFGLTDNEASEIANAIKEENVQSVTATTLTALREALDILDIEQIE
jgi:phage gpG-like protein